MANPLLEFMAQRAADPNEDPLKRRIAAHAAATMPKNLLDVLTAPVTGPTEMAGLGMEAAGNTSRAITGAAAVGGAKLGLAPAGSGAEAAQRAFDQSDGDILTRLIAANEGAASVNPIAAGVANMAVDPTNLIPIPTAGVGKLLQARRAKTALLKLLSMPETVPGNVPADKLIPGIGRRGKPGIGPELPPVVAPELPPVQGPALPPELGPALEDFLRGNSGRKLGPGLPPELGPPSPGAGSLPDLFGRPGNARGPLGPDLPPTLGPDLPPELGPLLEDFLRGNAGKKLGPDLPPLQGPPSPGASRLPELYGRRGNAGKPLGPPAPAPENLLLDLAPPAPTPAALYDDFLAAARGVSGELPGPSASFWGKLGADPQAVRGFFERGVAENLLGQTHAGTFAVKPGALAPRVPATPRSIADRWVEEAYGPKAFKAWPNLLKKLGAEVTPEGIFRGDQDITGPVVNYLTDRADIKSKPLALARYQQLVDEIAPAVDEAVPNVDIADDAGRMLDEQLQLIEASPYFQVFKHFTPTGELKKINPITGQRLNVREGGKFSRGRAHVWNIPGSGYDEVAAAAMESVGGYNPANAPSADDFWDRAQQAFRQYKQLKRGNEIAPSDFAGDIAAGGGGGGGMGIVPFLLPHGAATTAAGAGVGGLTGATAGATAGFIQGEGDLGDRLGNAKEGALTGAVLGAGLGGIGGGSIAKNTTAQAARDIIAKSNAAGVAGTKAAFGEARTKPTSLGGLFSYWSGQVVRHPRNIFNDELWSDVVTGALTPRSRQYVQGVRESLAARMDQADPYDRLSAPVQSLLATFGKGRDFLPDIGTPLAKSIEDDALSIGQETLYSTALSALNPQGFGQNLLGVVAGGPVKAAATTWWRPFFNAANGVLNNTFREAALVGEAGKFAAMGRQALIDAGQTGFAQFSDDGLFTAQEVAAKLGPREAAVWQQVQDNALELAQGRVKFLFGDYGTKGFVERKVGRVIPFASWMIRAYPVALEMALAHPVVALGIYHALRGLSQGAGEDGRPGYTAGMVPLRDKAGLLTGGQGNTTYLDVIGSISPVGGEMFAGEENPNQDKTAYQEISQGLSKLSLPGFNPIVQGLAYIMGMDFKSPSALSRTQGLENALGLIPGNPNLPDIGGGALRGLRGMVSPLVAETEIGALAGADADPTPEQYDPIGRRYSELVLEQTGRRLNDPANQKYLLDLAFGRGDLYQRAEREALIGGAARNLASLSSPVGAVAQTEAARRAKVATSANPYTFQAVQAQPQGTAGRRTIEAARKEYLRADPWAEPYSIGGRQEANQDIMEQILARYRRAGVRPTQAGIQEQLRLMEERAARTR